MIVLLSFIFQWSHRFSLFCGILNLKRCSYFECIRTLLVFIQTFAIYHSYTCVLQKSGAWLRLAHLIAQQQRCWRLFHSSTLWVFKYKLRVGLCKVTTNAIMVKPKRWCQSWGWREWGMLRLGQGCKLICEPETTFRSTPMALLSKAH